MKDLRLLSFGLYTAIAVCIIDQISKWWVLTYVLDGVRHVFVTSWFNVVLSWNRGVTFGMFNHHAEWQPYAFSVIALIIAVILIHWLWRATRFTSALGIGMILGGAIGNVIDRVRLGAVMDFLDFHMGTYHWYAFNVADSAIVGGVLVLLLEGMLDKKAKGER